MAITVNNPQNNGSSSASTNSFSYTVSGGNNQIICSLGSSASPTLRTHDSVTYNGDALTKSIEIDHTSGWSVHASLWYRLAPDQVTANIILTLSSSANRVIQSVLYLEGAAQNSPEATGSDTDTASPANTAITTLTDNAMVVGGVSHDPGGALAPETGTVEDAELNFGAGSHASVIGHHSVASGGASSLGWTYTDGGALNAIVAAAWEAAGGNPLAMTMGL